MRRPFRRWTIALTLAALSAACVNTRPGDTLFRVHAADLREEKTIRRQLWRVNRAVEHVRLRYALDDITVSVSVTDMGGLGAATPALSGLANVSGARIVVNKRLFLEKHPDLDAVLVGLLAHEMMHAVHYARMSEGDLIELGRRYRWMMKNPDGPHRQWVRAYERLTDMMTIRMGFGEELVFQKRASEANLAANHPPGVWDFYLKEEEIRAMMADPQLLRAEMEAAVEVLGLPSARRMLDIEPMFDEEGDWVPLRRR